jgi:hypothetical protein
MAQLIIELNAIRRNFNSQLKSNQHSTIFQALFFCYLLCFFFLGFSSPLKHNAIINGSATIDEKKHVYKGDMYNYARDRDFLNCFYTTCKK